MPALIEVRELGKEPLAVDLLLDEKVFLGTLDKIGSGHDLPAGIGFGNQGVIGAANEAVFLPDIAPGIQFAIQFPVVAPGQKMPVR